VETRLWSTVDHLDPPDLPRHGCNSDRGPAASGGPTVLANDRNGGRRRLNASRHDDDDDEIIAIEVMPLMPHTQTHTSRGISLLQLIHLISFRFFGYNRLVLVHELS